MGLEKPVPAGVLAADRSGIKTVAVANVVDGRITHLDSEVVLGAHDPVAAPGRIFLDELDNELLQFQIHRGSANRISFGEGPLLGDEGTEPAEQGLGRDDCCELSKATPADELGFASKADSLSVREALGFAAELFQENAIFLLEIFNDHVLVAVHPAGDRKKQELELCCHAAKNPSKVPPPQSSRCIGGVFWQYTVRVTPHSSGRSPAPILRHGTIKGLTKRSACFPEPKQNLRNLNPHKPSFLVE